MHPYCAISTAVPTLMQNCFDVFEKYKKHKKTQKNRIFTQNYPTKHIQQHISQLLKVNLKHLQSHTIDLVLFQKQLFVYLVIYLVGNYSIV